jgi:hypothetical protein
LKGKKLCNLLQLFLNFCVILKNRARRQFTQPAMHTTTSRFSGSSHDQQVWESLKQAIVSSSGFQRWQQQASQQEFNQMSLDAQIRRYLRETLATLAY